MHPFGSKQYSSAPSETKVRHDSVLEGSFGGESKCLSPTPSTRKGIKIDDLLLAAPATILIDTTESNRTLFKSKTTTQRPVAEKQRSSHILRATGRSRLIRQAIYPRPKLLAAPPSTETLAPGTHLSTDAKRWRTRDSADQHFVSSFTVHDIDTLRLGNIDYAPGLLALLQAAAACAKQASQVRKARRRCKARRNP